MTTDTYKPKLIAQALKAHHERHRQGFVCQADGNVYYQARAVRGWLEITPDFGLNWFRLQESEAVFTDRAGLTLPTKVTFKKKLLASPGPCVL